MEASPLARLPRELRDLIYEHTFHLNSIYASRLDNDKIQHDLTRTCRALRQETLSLYLSLARFNAHLDDGPATPLAHWLAAIGPEQCLLLREVGIWDMHHWNGSLHGTRAIREMLRQGSEDGNAYCLRPLERGTFPGSWFLKEVVRALESIGLRLDRFCEVPDGDREDLKQTSHFAIVRAIDRNDERSPALDHGGSSMETSSARYLSTLEDFACKAARMI